MTRRDQILHRLREENHRMVKDAGRVFREDEIQSLSGKLNCCDDPLGYRKILEEAVQKVREESLEYQI